MGPKQERGQGDEGEKQVAGAGWEINHNKIDVEMPKGTLTLQTNFKY